MDGAQFDNLTAELANLGIAHRSLYRNVQDIELVRAGPWLIDPYGIHVESTDVWGGLPFTGSFPKSIADDTLNASLSTETKSHDAAVQGVEKGSGAAANLELILQLASDTPAIVFWMGDAALTEPRLWKHVRSLNMALVPKSSIADEVTVRRTLRVSINNANTGNNTRTDSAAPAFDGSTDESSGLDTETHEAVIFRYPDGNVLAEVLPVLDSSQFTRFFGPALSVTFYSPAHPSSIGSNIRQAFLPNVQSKPRPGLLRLEEEQIKLVEKARVQLTVSSVGQYLREVSPNQALAVTPKEFEQQVQTYVEQSASLGVTSEASHCRWAYMQLLSGGRMYSNPHVLDAMRADDTGISKNERVRILMESTLARLRVA
jgi:hypothetical protein